MAISRKGIDHISWKPILPKDRFLKRRGVRWKEGLRKWAHHILSSAGSSPELRKDASEFLAGLRRIKRRIDWVPYCNAFQGRFRAWHCLGERCWTSVCICNCERCEH